MRAATCTRSRCIATANRCVVEVRANAFLHHMVRNIVGSLLVVGAANNRRRWIAEVAGARDRTIAGPTAPPRGLVFIGPLYPRQWGWMLCRRKRPSTRNDLLSPVVRPLFRTRIRFCGLTRPGDVRLAASWAPTRWASCSPQGSPRRMRRSRRGAMRDALARRW